LEKQYVTQSVVNRFVKGKQSKARGILFKCNVFFMLLTQLYSLGMKKARLTKENEALLEIGHPMEEEAEILGNISSEIVYSIF
jgi:hypothetical protein